MNSKLLGILAGVALAVVLFWPAGSSKKVERLYNEAEQLYTQNDYEGSIGKYNQALEESVKWGVNTRVIDKDFPTFVNYKIAVNYSKWAEQSGDITYYDNAIEQIEKVAPNATVPKHQEGLTYLWGHVLYKQEKFEIAEPKFHTLIENFPNSLFVENAWYAIGQINYKLQKYDSARRAYKEVLDGFPNSDFKDDAQHLIALCLFNEKNYAQAHLELDLTTKILKSQIDPQKKALYTFLKKNNDKQAESEFDKDFKFLIDTQAEVMYKAAFCLNQLGWDKKAINRYTQFITEHPQSSYITAAYFDIGTIYSKQKDYDNARINFEHALQSTDDPVLQTEIQNTIDNLPPKEPTHRKRLDNQIKI